MRKALNGICANWLGLASSALVAFFLTPFVLHRLGDSGFGLWLLVSTFTGYYGLLDFGLRSAVLRYVARHAATNDWENLGRVLSTTLATYSIIAAVILTLALASTWQFDALFHVPAESMREAKLLLLVIGIGSALGVPVGVFAGVLEGLQEFFWINAVQVASAALRAVLIVITLSSGYGLVMLGIITVGSNVGGSLAYALIAFKIYPRLRIRYTYVRISTLRTLGGFGLVVFWIGLAQQLRFQTDALVIGSLLSVQAISFFGIGAKLVAYTTDAVQATAQVFTPMSSRFDATGSLEGLRRVLVTGNRYSSFVMLPLATILLVTGKSIILVWVGARYLSSYPVLAILIVPTTLYLMQAASTKVLYGMARHRRLAAILVLEGTANVVLSIVLARRYGINGVALGTAIPLACTSVLFLPIHLCRVLGLRLRNYVCSAYWYPVLLSAPLALVLWISDRWIRPHNYPELLLVLSLGGLAYVPGVLVYFYCRERKEFIDGAVSEELQSSSSG